MANTERAHEARGNHEVPTVAAEAEAGNACYVGRLAPSPTGYLHLGHAATFLAAHDRARRAGGRLLLRIDDLDPQRSREMFVEAAQQDLLWLGLRWDFKFRQTARLARYRAAMLQLLTLGLVYPCQCSRKDLQHATEAPHEEGDEPVYNGRCRPAASASSGGGASGAVLMQGGSAAGMQQRGELLPANYRFRTENGEVVRFTDGRCGSRQFAVGAELGDFVVWRKDGLPSYQLACVVDDVDAGVTEVVRGEDLLRSTARQLLLQRALKVPSPAYFHTPLLRDEHGQRLAKRNYALNLRSLRQAGVSPGEIRARVEACLHQTKI